MSASTEPQSASAVFMVRPANFGFNVDTSASNRFQQRSDAAAPGEHQRLALPEFDALGEQLQRAGVRVFIGADSPAPVKPDAIFPNNWVSFHHDGTVVLYPMLAPNRRAERREELIEQLSCEGGFAISRRIDLSAHEAQQQFLEGTGSLVLDRPHRQAFACLSPRTDLNVLGDFAQQLDYEIVGFEAFGADGTPVYHTNVVMAIGAAFAAICGEAIADADRRAAVFAILQDSGHQLIDISRAQMSCFAGNLLQLQSGAGALIVISEQAWRVLLPTQRKLLERHGSIVLARIPHIERIGGGSVRCMLAEVHLPKRRAV
jgi:hypothetical protein